VSDTLRSFRRNVVHIRQALDLFKGDPGRVGVESGYLQDEGLVERYKRLSIPVRRALNPTDRAAFSQAITSLASLHASGSTARLPPDRMAGIDSAWAKLQADLSSPIMLGGTKVPRRQILGAWLDAAAFYDKLERDRAYDRLIDEYGKAAEGIGTELTDEAVRVILMLDEAAATVLGEPVILPPAPKTPPPPPDPKESLWRRLFPRRVKDD
jgi:hypothetical protein